MRALEIHAYNSLTEDSLPALCSLYTAHPHIPSEPPPSQRPALSELTNTALEPGVPWSWANTADEGLMEPDVKGETQRCFSASLQNSQSNIRVINGMK